MAKINYDAINFKNKDVDRFSTKFGNGDPIKNYSPDPAVQDSILASRGYTPKGDGRESFIPKSKAEKQANQQSARQSAPSRGIKVDNSAAMKIRKETEAAGKPRPTFMPKK